MEITKELIRNTYVESIYNYYGWLKEKELTKRLKRQVTNTSVYDETQFLDGLYLWNILDEQNKRDISTNSDSKYSLKKDEILSTLQQSLQDLFIDAPTVDLDMLDKIREAYLTPKNHCGDDISISDIPDRIDIQIDSKISRLNCLKSIVAPKKSLEGYKTSSLGDVTKFLEKVSKISSYKEWHNHCDDIENIAGLLLMTDRCTLDYIKDNRSSSFVRTMKVDLDTEQRHNYYDVEYDDGSTKEICDTYDINTLNLSIKFKDRSFIKIVGNCEDGFVVTFDAKNVKHPTNCDYIHRMYTRMIEIAEETLIH